jgi:hypothetical protein
MGLDEADTARAFVKTTGDGVLIELGSVVGTVRYAIGLQKQAAEPPANKPGVRQIPPEEYPASARATTPARHLWCKRLHYG